MGELITVWGVSRPVEGGQPGLREVYIPYPSSFRTGSREAAEWQADANRASGYLAVRMECRVVEER